MKESGQVEMMRNACGFFLLFLNIGPMTASKRGLLYFIFFVEMEPKW